MQVRIFQPQGSVNDKYFLPQEDDFWTIDVLAQDSFMKLFKDKFVLISVAQASCCWHYLSVQSID